MEASSSSSTSGKAWFLPGTGSSGGDPLTASHHARRLSWLSPKVMVVLDESDVVDCALPDGGPPESRDDALSLSGEQECCSGTSTTSAVVQATASSSENRQRSNSGSSTGSRTSPWTGLRHYRSGSFRRRRTTGPSDGSNNDENPPTPLPEPTTEAYPVDSGLVTASQCLSQSPHLAETGEAMPVGHLRPEYIYVKVFKKSPTSPIGIVLRPRRDTGAVVVARIKRDGALVRSLLQPGDQILAINGVSCIQASAPRVAKLIRNARKAVSIVVWNKGGDPNLVSCTVQKPAQESKVGVCIRNDHGAVRVSRVHPEGLFAGSLLLPGHRCIQINGIRCDGLRSKDAASMISYCHEFVTIVSRPKQECAIVLSCEVKKAWWSSLGASFAFPAGALRAVVASQTCHV